MKPPSEHFPLVSNLNSFIVEKISLTEAIKKPTVNCKVPIYKNNGFGRDTYISYLKFI